VITVDLHRTLPWLAMAAADLHITLPEDPVPSLHAHRVLAAIDLANRYLVYTQGYDRYVLILYLLTLQFTTQWQLPPEVAESLTFHLTNKVLLLANLPVFLDCSKSTEKKFQLLDNAVHKRLPVLSKALKSYGHTSLHYALRWRLLLFSEEHPVREVFVLWDAIFAAKDSVDAFFEDLMVAHLRQIKIGGDRGLVERIQKHRDWDCEELLWGAWEDFRARRSRAWRWYLVFVVVVLVLLQLLPYCFRQTQI
jgi:hypothetical protein